MRITMKGDSHYALWHFALYGAAAVLEQAFPEVTVSVCWQNPDSAELLLDGQAGLTDELVARALHEHARGHTDSWVQALHDHRSGKKATTVGTFSPRLPLPADADSWQVLQDARNGSIDQLLADRSWLDLAFISALGEPAYWYLDRDGKLRPDLGASGWEMKTRNRGEEFAQHRLAPLANSVTAREPLQVLHGLQGSYFADEASRNSVNSRTPTGLRPPYPTDNALAWFALWGMSFFPVRHRALNPEPRSRDQGARSVTTAQLRHHMPRVRLTRAYTVLPYMEQPLRLSTLRSVLVSGALARQGAVLIRSQDPDSAASAPPSPADSAWLRSKGVRAIVTSALTASDNPNAPELAVDRGRMWVLPR